MLELKNVSFSVEDGEQLEIVSDPKFSSGDYDLTLMEGR